MMFSPMPTTLEEAKREILSWREMYRQQVAEVKQLRQDAKRWQTVRDGSSELTLRLHNSRADQREAIVDAAMKGQQP